MYLIRSERWRELPPHSVDVDWGHPLTRGLISALPLNGVPADIVSGKIFTRDSEPYLTRGGLFTDGVDDFAQIVDFYRGGLTLEVPLTMAAFYTVDKDSALLDNLANTDVFFMLRSTGTNYEDFELALRNHGSGVTQFGAGTRDSGAAGAAYSVSPNRSFAQVDSVRFFVVGVFVSITSRFLYVNGVQAPENTTSKNAQVNDLFIGKGTASGFTPAYAEGSHGVTQNCLVWNRALNPDEVVALWKEPYSIYRPKLARTYVFFDAGLPPISGSMAVTTAADSSAAAGIVETPQQLPPVADTSDGAWLPSVGGEDLFNMIDETPPSDTDYIYTGSASITKLKLANASDPGEHRRHQVDIRLKGDGTSDLLVRWLQGTTVIKEWTITNPSTSETDYRFTLSEAEAANITNYNDLYIELEAV